MPVSYDSYEAKAVERVIAMLADSATFRTLVAAATAAAAKQRIVESWGGEPRDAAGDERAVACDGTAFAAVPPFAHVHCAELTPTLEGIGVYSYAGTVMIGLAMPRRAALETPGEAMRRGRNVLGAIRLELTTMLGGSTYLATATISTQGPEVPDDTGADRDAIFGTITIDFEG